MIKSLFVLVLLCSLCVSHAADFWGRMEISSDRGDTLPVYVDGELRGHTPLYLDSIPVGRYSVSFLPLSLRDSLLSGKATIENLPQVVRAVFRGDKDGERAGLRLLVELAEQKIVLQNGVTAAVVFPLYEIDIGVKEAAKKNLLYVVVGSAVVTVFGIFLMIML